MVFSSLVFIVWLWRLDLVVFVFGGCGAVFAGGKVTVPRRLRKYWGLRRIMLGLLVKILKSSESGGLVRGGKSRLMWIKPFIRG